MPRLSKHFSAHEFACKGKFCCSNSAPISPQLIQALEDLRLLINAENEGDDLPIRIHSGFRCLTHNRQIQSSDYSQHPLGLAADISVTGLTQLQLAHYAKQIPKFASGGIGLYTDFIHLDIRHNGPARW